MLTIEDVRDRSRDNRSVKGRDYAKRTGIKVVATNRKATEYFLLEHFEAGLALQGSEIKSIRAGQVSLTEAYVQTDGNEAWLINAHIAPYDFASRQNHDPVRPRRLLLHKRRFASCGIRSGKKG